MSEKKITTLAQALVKAQSKLKNPAMDAINPHFKSKFASLKSVREAIIPVFNEEGLAIVQKSAMADGGLAVNTVIVHESGEEMDCGTLFIPVRNDNPQSYCSAMTYARRYTLQAVAGVVGDPDDDGNSASEPAGKPKPTNKPKSNKPSAAMLKFLKAMGEMKAKLGDDRYYKILGSHGYEKSSEIEKKEHQIAVWKEMDMVVKAEEEMSNE